MITNPSHPVILRLASPEFDELQTLLFQRYPRQEWATFARFGWRDTSDGLVLTLASLDAPTDGDLDEQVDHVLITEPYSLRVALTAEAHPLAVGIAHSHPLSYAPRPSWIDDDMDRYYSDYLRGFAPSRPYVSIVLSQVEGELAISGRVFWKDEWLRVDHVAAERTSLRVWTSDTAPVHAPHRPGRSARFASAFGDEAAARLHRARVTVIGAGGTGSAAIEVLARAGVGHLVIVDPDHIEESNLERVHGSYPEHAAHQTAKVVAARDHIHAIDPTIKVEAYRGALPQPEIVDAILKTDIALGCTDQQHSRLALSDLAFRYLLPSIDCGVMLEGHGGAVTGQVVQLVRFLASDPCALCRDMIQSERVAQELMSEDEREQRRAAARAAQARGEGATAYWHDLPQLNTVGYLTTMIGAMAAGYAIGWLSGRFDLPFTRLQANIVAPLLDVTDIDEKARPGCPCRRCRGWSDQAAADALITPPSHWAAAQRL